MVEGITNNQTRLIDILNEVLNLVTDKETDIETVTKKIEEAKEIANSTQNDTMAIMDALHFQDITTQQMNQPRVC